MDGCEMDGWMDVRSQPCIDVRWMDGWMDGCEMDGWMDVRWMDGWMDGCEMDGWMDGWM